MSRHIQLRFNAQCSSFVIVGLMSKTAIRRRRS